MNNLDIQDLEQKIHHWSSTIGNAAIPHGWKFAVEFNGEIREHWPGLSMNDAVFQKMLDIILDETIDTPLRTRMEVMDETCGYIAQVIAERNLPERVLVREGSQERPSLDFPKLIDYIHDVYFAHLHIRSRIQNVLGARMNAEVQRSTKNKM